MGPHSSKEGQVRMAVKLLKDICDIREPRASGFQGQAERHTGGRKLAGIGRCERRPGLEQTQTTGKEWSLPNRQTSTLKPLLHHCAPRQTFIYTVVDN